MSWLFGAKKSSPEPPPMQAQKLKQITHLKTVVHGVVEVQKGQQYHVPFKVHGQSFLLDIVLTGRFPLELPEITVKPLIRHAWVDESSGRITGCSALNSFNVHSDISKIVRQIIDEFQRSPTTSLPYSPPTQYTTGYNNSLPSYTTNVAMPTLPSFTQQTAQNIGIYNPENTALSPPKMSRINTYNMPEIPLHFDQLNTMSIEELQLIDSDEAKLFDLLQSLPQLSQISSDREKITAAIETIARENLSQKPVLEQRKRALLEKYEEMNDIRSHFDESAKRQDAQRAAVDPDALRTRLSVAAREAEEEGDVFADRFLSGDLSVEEFKQKYMGQRVLYHKRTFLSQKQ